MSDIAQLFENKVMNMAESIMSDVSHPLNGCYKLLNSGRRLRSDDARMSRSYDTFVPYSITLYNKNYGLCIFIVDIHFDP